MVIRCGITSRKEKEERMEYIMLKILLSLFTHLPGTWIVHGQFGSSYTTWHTYSNDDCGYVSCNEKAFELSCPPYPSSLIIQLREFVRLVPRPGTQKNFTRFGNS